MAKNVFRTAYDGVSVDPLIIEGESLTRQEFKEETDINCILEKWLRTGLNDHVTTREQRFADVTLHPDYRTVMNHVAIVNEVFESLPAEDRLYFKNDPGKYLDFVSDPANLGKMVEMGLASPAQVEAFEASRKPSEPISGQGVPVSPVGGESPNNGLS